MNKPVAPDLSHLAALLRIPQVDPDTGFEISPDGRQVAFSWNQTGTWEIYVTGLEGGQPYQVSQAPGAKFTPRWSPDGGALAFCLDLDGGENYDLYRYDFETGRQVNLTPGTPETIHPCLSWSPDGAWLALICDREGDFAPYLVPATGGKPRLLRTLPYPASELTWSPDGRWLAVVCEGRGQDQYLYLLPISGAEPIGLGDQDGPIPARQPAWAPDSNRLAFVSDQSGEFQIGIFDLWQRKIDWITQDGGAKDQPQWSPDGGRLVYLQAQGPRNWVEILQMDTGLRKEFSLAPGIHHWPIFTPTGGELLLTFENPARPPDLWRLELTSGAFRALTDSRPPAYQDAAFVLPEEVTYPSLDGVSVPALYFAPPGIQRPPAVLYIHGGPNWLAQISWDAGLQAMLARGWAILAPNYRGSTGYGRDWQLASRFDFGRVDAWDVVAGADWLVRQGLADPDRIVLTGRSWGGYLTMVCLTRYPARWAAGSAVVPFLNWFTGHANSRADLQYWDRENFGDPVKDDDRYYERSPYFFLDKVQAPVQLICGANDPRCPASESLQAQARLLAAGKSCELLLFPDEGHTFLKLENILQAETQRMAFLERVLTGSRPAQVR